MDHFTDLPDGAIAAEPPRTRQRRVVRIEPMHTNAHIGPTLAAETRLHAANIEAELPDGPERRVGEARVALLRRWAAEIETGLEGGA